MVVLLNASSRKWWMNLTLSRTTCLLVWTTHEVTMSTEKRKSPCRLAQAALRAGVLLQQSFVLPELALNNELNIKFVKVFSGFLVTKLTTLFTYPVVFTTPSAQSVKTETLHENFSKSGRSTGRRGKTPYR